MNNITLNTSIIPNRPEPLHALMCTPDFFNIVDVKNIHMQGNHGKLDPIKFLQQWQSIYDLYLQESSNKNIDNITQVPGVEGREDMVFCANQSFPWITQKGRPFVIMSRMKYPSRQSEIEHFQIYYETLGYDIYDPPGKGLLEGMGDLIPVPGKRLIFGGYGHRTDLTTLNLLVKMLDCKIVPLELIHGSFYHLDTCFIPLDTNTALIAREAFTSKGLDQLKLYFKEIIEIPFSESSKGFALNAHAVIGHQYPFAIIQKGNSFTIDILTQKGYKVYEVDTSEFMKSGGSVFCMKMMHY